MAADPTAVAAAFAAALDADDFAAAAALLAPDCVYFTGTALLSGPPAIMAAYREASAWAHATFERVAYQSAVETDAGGALAIRFTDVIEQGGRHHRYTCRQQVTVGADGLIRHLAHHELPGERAALEAFFAVCGVAR